MIEGIGKAAARFYGLTKVPDSRAIEKYGERLEDLLESGSLYLWHSIDLCVSIEEAKEKHLYRFNQRCRSGGDVHITLALQFVNHRFQNIGPS